MNEFWIGFLIGGYVCGAIVTAVFMTLLYLMTGNESLKSSIAHGVVAGLIWFIFIPFIRKF